MVLVSGKCLLRERLKDADMTMTQLAEKLNMQISQLSDYANNRRKMSLDTAASIAYMLGCAINNLYEWTPRRRR